MSLYVVVTQRSNNHTERNMNTTNNDYFKGWHFDPATGRRWPTKDGR